MINILERILRTLGPLDRKLNFSWVPLPKKKVAPEIDGFQWEYPFPGV